MNKIFISGIVIEDIDYKFIINNKHSAIAKIKIRTYKKQVFEVIAYDNIADLSLRKLNKNNLIYIEGRINSKMEIEAKDITYML